MKKLLILFLTFLKIGAFTFGGGYAMIALFQRECVEKKNWLSQDEFLDLIAIAESTPGPIAVNSATYIGYKVGKFLGSALATLGVVLPSLVIIFVISLFFDKFVSLTVVSYAFYGIRACVTYLILSAGVKMLRSLTLTPFNVIVATATLVALVCCNLFAVGFSTVFYILISGTLGLFLFLLGKIRKDKGEKDV